MKGALRELAGLFVDDGALALTIITIVLLSVILSTLRFEVFAGVLLAFGCPLTLLMNTQVAARKRKSGSQRRS